MRRFVLVVIAVTLLRGAAVHAANYVQTDGTVVDPILDTSGGTHSYSGNDLEGGEDLRSAILTNAQLTHADLTLADLNGAELANATLAGVRSGGNSPPKELLTQWEFRHGYLVGPLANLTDAVLTGATLTGATLTGATWRPPLKLVREK